jgi:putrescine transport system substrate-binding protein
MWGTTGIGINWTAAERAGVKRTSEVDWSFVFDSEKREAFIACGIVPLNERDEVFAAALKYAGYSVNSTDKSELSIASDYIKSLAGDVKYFHSGIFNEELASGDACMVIGYSGDILAEAYKAESDDIEYYIPEQGTAVWYDLLAIPSNAMHTEAAHAFINFLTSPEVAAANTNYNAYPNPLDTSLEYVDEEILHDEKIYPNEEVLKRLEGFSVLDRRTKRLKKKLWVIANCTAGAYCEVPFSLYGDY